MSAIALAGFERASRAVLVEAEAAVSRGDVQAFTVAMLKLDAMRANLHAELRALDAETSRALGDTLERAEALRLAIGRRMAP